MENLSFYVISLSTTFCQFFFQGSMNYQTLINQLYTFRDQNGETVGTMMFRLFKFRPRDRQE